MVLEMVRAEALQESPELLELTAALTAVNERLWQSEDDIRHCEKAGDFGPRFVELARSVYRQNDERAALKQRISEAHQRVAALLEKLPALPQELSQDQELT